MGENILSGIISGVLSGVFLTLFQKMLLPHNEKKEERSSPFNTIQPEKVIIIKKDKNERKSKDSEYDFSFIIICLLMFVMLALVNYIKYSEIVYFAIIAMSTAVGIMAIGMGCVCIKKRMRFRNDLNILLFFNMSALIIVPMLIWQTNRVSETRNINLRNLKLQLSQKALFLDENNKDTIIFLVYQILGLMFIVIYMLGILISNIYLVSLINLNLNSKLKRMWNFFIRRTYILVAKPTYTIVFEIILLIISYLMVSGTILDLLLNN